MTTELNNADQFIDFYNKIDKLLNKKGNYDDTVWFAHKVRELAINGGVISKFKDELLSLGSLRNAIVHNPRIGNKTIAEPHHETLIRIKRIYEVISNPQKVAPKFIYSVMGAKEEDYINQILFEIYKKSFSQFPIYRDNKVVELINVNTIARWLSNAIEESGTIMIEKVKISGLMKFIEFPKNYKFVSQSTSIYDAFDIFMHHMNQNKRHLDAIFITPSGKESDQITGLITIEDIAAVMQHA